MLIQTLSLPMVKGAGALLLGGIVLWQVVDHCGSTRGVAIVHVALARVTVTIDESRYWIETLEDTPIVAELRPGRHVVRMLRGQSVIFEEEFTLAPGRERILSAWDPSDERGIPIEADRAAAEIGILETTSCQGKQCRDISAVSQMKPSDRGHRTAQPAVRSGPASSPATGLSLLWRALSSSGI
jgi:hypothetical protein